MGWVGSIVSVSWVGLGWVKKNGPTSISGPIHLWSLCNRLNISALEIWWWWWWWWWRVWRTDGRVDQPCAVLRRALIWAEDGEFRDIINLWFSVIVRRWETFRSWLSAVSDAGVTSQVRQIYDRWWHDADVACNYWRHAAFNVGCCSNNCTRLVINE